MPDRPSKRNAKPWQLSVQDAERPVDADAFLRRLADVLLEVDAKEENPTTTQKEQ